MSEKVPIRESLFIETADGFALIGNKCTSCGQVFFPKAKTICLNCYNDQLEDLELSCRGELYSYSESHLPSFNFMPPYKAGYILLPENVRLFSQLEEVEGKPFKIGMEMELVIDKLFERKEKEYIGYKFRPV